MPTRTESLVSSVPICVTGSNKVTTLRCTDRSDCPVFRAVSAVKRSANFKSPSWRLDPRRSPPCCASGCSASYAAAGSPTWRRLVLPSRQLGDLPSRQCVVHGVCRQVGNLRSGSDSPCRQLGNTVQSDERKRQLGGCVATAVGGKASSNIVANLAMSLKVASPTWRSCSRPVSNCRQLGDI